MDLVGKVLGNRYEIIKKIGMGGMATVYKARCNVLNRYVAVKVLREEFITDEEFIKRFNSEAQSAASLTHPNIVSIYDVANEGNIYYIVMELIKGKTLKEIIDTDGVLSWKWTVNIAMQIAQALDIAHKNNIIHRDIKPHNIIITEDGVAKVTDFGIAKAVSNSTITAFGTTMGSVHYFSPEHAKGGFTDAKSDIYSLGVVLYEMLTGRVPFDADTPVSIALKHMQEEAIEPIKLNPNIPQSLNDIIMKAMSKEINSRYLTATDMLEDLSETLKNPDGDFVRMSEDVNIAKTQRVQTIKDGEDDEFQEMKGNKKGKKSIFSKYPFLKVILIIVLVIGLFAGAIAVGFNIINSSKPKDVLIPNLVGMTEEEAQTTLIELGLQYQLLEERFDEEVEAGKILQQDPVYIENFKIKENNVISVVISKGKEIIEVPQVIGKKLDEAQKELKDLGLRVEIEEEFDDKIEAGYVTKQEPIEGEEVAGKSTVTITVSKGIEMVTVPNLLGKSLDEAKKLIEDAKLKLAAIINETDTTKEDKVIIKQTLESGKEVEIDTEIMITVNSLPQIKTGTVNINVRSFTGYVEPSVNETPDTSLPGADGENTVDNTVTVEPQGPKNVNVTVKVTSQGSEDTVYMKEVPENTENISATFEGVGTVTVKVYIAGVLEKTSTLNLNQENPVLNISGDK